MNGPWTKLTENCTVVLCKGCSLFPVPFSLKWKVFPSTLQTVWQTGFFKRFSPALTSHELSFYSWRWTWNLKFLLTIFSTCMTGFPVEFDIWFLLDTWAILLISCTFLCCSYLKTTLISFSKPLLCARARTVAIQPWLRKTWFLPSWHIKVFLCVLKDWTIGIQL